jgi:hypothetical protein
MLVKLEFTADFQNRRNPKTASRVGVFKGEIIANYTPHPVFQEGEQTWVAGVIGETDGMYECWQIENVLMWTKWDNEHPWVDGKALWDELEATPEGEEKDKVRERLFAEIARLRYGCVDSLEQVMEECRWAIESDDPYVIGYHAIKSDPIKGYDKHGGYHGTEETEPDKAIFFEVVKLLPRESNDA